MTAVTAVTAITSGCFPSPSPPSMPDAVTRLLLLPSSMLEGMLMPRIPEWSKPIQSSHHWLTSISVVVTSNTVIATEFDQISPNLTNSMHSLAVGIILLCIFGWWWMSIISPPRKPRLHIYSGHTSSCMSTQMGRLHVLQQVVSMVPLTPKLFKSTFGWWSKPLQAWSHIWCIIFVYFLLIVSFFVNPVLLDFIGEQLKKWLHTWLPFKCGWDRFSEVSDQ